MTSRRGGNGEDDEHLLFIFRSSERVIKIEDQIKDIKRKPGDGGNQTYYS